METIEQRTREGNGGHRRVRDGEEVKMNGSVSHRNSVLVDNDISSECKLGGEKSIEFGDQPPAFEC